MLAGSWLSLPGLQQLRMPVLSVLSPLGELRFSWSSPPSSMLVQGATSHKHSSLCDRASAFLKSFPAWCSTLKFKWKLEFQEPSAHPGITFFVESNPFQCCIVMHQGEPSDKQIVP
ncbi:unnamed protein product [Arctogadus glacialis]